VPEVVQRHAAEVGRCGGGCPATANGVLVRRPAGCSGEAPGALRAVGRDVLGEQIDR
jgi:hypothetical protein